MIMSDRPTLDALEDALEEAAERDQRQSVELKELDE